MAGKHKIVPYHNAFFVAKRIKLVVFVNSAAPDADEIAVHIFYSVNYIGVFFFIFAVVNVDRSMIYPFDLYRFVIYKNLKITVFADFFRISDVNASYTESD